MPTNRYKYKYFHFTVQRAKDRRQKFHFCRLPFDVRPLNVKLDLSIITKSRYALIGYFITSYPTRAHGIIVMYKPIETCGLLLK